jgi:hypothetical protein
MPSPEIVNDV